MEFGQHAFRLDRPDKSGVSLRAKLLKVAERTGKLPAELRDEPQLSAPAAQVYGWFNELAAARSSGFGPNPIGYQDILAWAIVTRRRVAPWQVQAIRALDGQMLKLAGDETRKEQARGV